MIFDSLGGGKESAINTIREYLTCEYEAKMKKRRVFDAINMPGQTVKSPAQPNLNDCGLFVLQNIEQFFKVMNFLNAAKIKIQFSFHNESFVMCRCYF